MVTREQGAAAQPLQTRRQFLRAGTTAAAVTLASGCRLLSTDPTNESEPENTGGKNPKESPTLTSQVKAGELPALTDRIPEEPLVVEPTDRIGRYGGTWQTCTMAVPGDAYEMIAYDGLVRWAPDWSEVVPNIARSWEIGSDGAEYTLELRKGMKWSDGEPFTAADIVFAVDDVLSNTELFPAFPSWLTVADTPVRVTSDSDDRITFVFAEPYTLFLERLASPDGNIFTALPRHFLAEFHAELNPDAADLAEKAGFNTWSEHFLSKGGDGLLNLGVWQTPELPTLLPWKVTTPMTGGQLVVQRNPFYWKTDPNGSQLPYLDEVVIEVVNDPEVAVLQTSEGRYSLPPSDVMTPQSKPVLARARESGGIHFVDWVTSTMNDAIIALNLTHRDGVMREIFQNKDFRIGLSHAIDRDEIINAVFQQQGEPWQVGPRDDSDFYDEQLATQYLEYDVDKANEHLDRAGYTERDGDNFRLGPAGDRIAFEIAIATGFKPQWVDAAELVKGYWAEVGVDVNVRSQADTLFTQRIEANQHDAVLYDGNAGNRDAILDPTWYFPYGSGSYFAIDWAAWYNSQGESGSEPPEGPRQQMELYDQLKATVDENDRRELFMEILGIARDEFYAIGIVKPAVGYNVVQNRMHNVPTSVPEAWLYPDPGPTRPEQFFLGEDA